MLRTQWSVNAVADCVGSAFTRKTRRSTIAALSECGYIFAEVAPPGPHRLGLAMSFVRASTRCDDGPATLDLQNPGAPQRQ